MTPLLVVGSQDTPGMSKSSRVGQGSNLPTKVTN